MHFHVTSRGVAINLGLGYVLIFPIKSLKMFLARSFFIN